MKRRLSVVLLLLVSIGLGSRALAQDQDSAAESADLRMRLVDVQVKETERQARLNQLDEELRPENIARSVSGFGSTRPEELREQRRRELTIERDSVVKQIELLAASRASLETAIQAADNRAYHDSSRGFASNQFQIIWESIKPRRFLIGSVVLFGLLAIGILMAFGRRSS